MDIKTITTTDGVNEVDFGSSASRFYWFRNVGTTTVHVSGKADITAGGDGVAELAAGDSVCIETLGGKVYVLGAGKVQIHNTGDKFCPFKNAPAAGGGEADAYTKSESDARYAQKSDIPSSLPANGGNADSADTLTDWGTRTVTDANDAPFGFCAALDCENAPNTFWSTILTTGSSGATKYKTQIAFPWAFGADENRIRYRCENNGEWGGWQEISTTPIKSETMNVSTDSSGNAVIFDAVENKKIISINCFVKQAVPFNYNNKQYGHFTENDGSPYLGSVSFTVYYIIEG